MLNTLMGVMIPQGSAHKNVKAPIDAVSIATWRLKSAGAEQELFGKKVVIDSLVNKLEKGTQEK